MVGGAAAAAVMGMCGIVAGVMTSISCAWETDASVVGIGECVF